MAFSEWKEIMFSNKGVIRELYDEVVANVGAIQAGIPADNSITAVKLMAGIVSFAKMDSNSKTVTHITRIFDSADTAGTNWEKSVYTAPFAMVVVGIKIIPDATFGQATDYSALAVTNKGSAGAGTNVLASKTFNSTNVATAFEVSDFGAISTPNLAAGDVLTLKKTHSGAGQAIPGAAVEILLQRAA